MIQDSAWISVKALQNLVIGHQQSKYLTVELKRSDSILLETRLASALRSNQDSLKIVALRYDSIQQRAVRVTQQGAIDQLYKTIRKQKRKTVLVGIAGILTTAGALYLGLK